MAIYSICHVNARPAGLADQWPKPRQLNAAYVAFRGTDPDTPAAYQVALDVEGQPTKTTLEVVADIAPLMYADAPGPFVLRRSEALDLMVTPHWAIYVGQYDDEAALLADCAALGITPAGADLAAKIVDAQLQLKTALSPTA